MDKEERAEVRKEQMRKNLSAIFDAVLEDHPAETLEIIALACFVEPEHVDDHHMSLYLQNIGEIIADESVLSFFTSLASLGNSGILTLVD